MADLPSNECLYSGMPEVEWLAILARDDKYASVEYCDVAIQDRRLLIAAVKRMAARLAQQVETAAPRIDYRNELRILLDSLTEDYELPAEAVARGNAAWRGEVKTPARYVRKETEDGPVTVECCPACGYPDRVIALKVQGEPELFVFGSAEATTVAQTALEYYGGRSSDGVSEKSSS